jgi:hypothetical protein
MNRLLLAATSAAIIAGASAPGGAQQRQTDDTFNWSGQIPQGRWIRIRNLNGPITVTPSTGDKVEVTATKTWRHGNPEVVHFDVQKFGPNQESVLICALWGDRSSCDERDYQAHGDRGVRNNDVRVEFRVLVPAGVKIGVGTVNGAVNLDGATTEVDASSVNGDVVVSASGGPVRASSVNGRVVSRLGKLDTDDDLSFSSVNGSIVAEFTGDLNASVDLVTVNGSLRTDYEITLTGRLDPRHLSAHVGKPGGPRIRLATVNGNVELRRR